MPGMKITLDAAMRARDVSRPRPEHEAAALAADRADTAGRPGRGTPPGGRTPATVLAATVLPAPVLPAPVLPAAGPSASVPTGPVPPAIVPAGPVPAGNQANRKTGRAAGPRGAGGKRHRSRKRFPR